MLARPPPCLYHPAAGASTGIPPLQKQVARLARAFFWPTQPPALVMRWPDAHIADHSSHQLRTPAYRVTCKNHSLEFRHNDTLNTGSADANSL